MQGRPWLHSPVAASATRILPSSLQHSLECGLWMNAKFGNFVDSNITGFDKKPKVKSYHKKGNSYGAPFTNTD